MPGNGRVAIEIHGRRETARARTRAKGERERERRGERGTPQVIMYPVRREARARRVPPPWMGLYFEFARLYTSA